MLGVHTVARMPIIAIMNLVVMIGVVHAQPPIPDSAATPARDGSAIRFGLRGGWNHAKLFWNDGGRFFTSHFEREEPTASVFATLVLTDDGPLTTFGRRRFKTELRGEMEYVMAGGDYRESMNINADTLYTRKLRRRLDYLRLPIQLRFTYMVSFVDVILFGGAYSAIRLSSSVEEERVYSGRLDEPNYTTTATRDLSTRPFDVGWVAGCSMEIPIGESRLELEARVSGGFFSPLPDNPDARNFTVSMGVGFQF